MSVRGVASFLIRAAHATRNKTSLLVVTSHSPDHQECITCASALLHKACVYGKKKLRRHCFCSRRRGTRRRPRGQSDAMRTSETSASVQYPVKIQSSSQSRLCYLVDKGHHFGLQNLTRMIQKQVSSTLSWNGLPLSQC